MNMEGWRWIGGGQDGNTRFDGKYDDIHSAHNEEEIRENMQTCICSERYIKTCWSGDPCAHPARGS